MKNPLKALLDFFDPASRWKDPCLLEVTNKNGLIVYRRDLQNDRTLLYVPDEPAPSEASGDVVEAAEIGERDGYEKAIQDLDIATGGDGEFKGSTFPGETVDVPVMKQRIIDRFTALTPAPQADAWRPIETAPLNDQFIAALEVRNNKTGQSWWEKHLIWIDDETGDVHSDCEQGWGLRDYIYWHPVPANPLTESQTDEA